VLACSLRRLESGWRRKVDGNEDEKNSKKAEEREIRIKKEKDDEGD
jgi:hypothetical protein